MKKLHFLYCDHENAVESGGEHHLFRIQSNLNSNLDSDTYNVGNFVASIPGLVFLIGSK